MAHSKPVTFTRLEHPPLTPRQEARIEEWRKEIEERFEITLRLDQLSWSVQNEVRPYRGHDLQVVALDNGYVAWLSVDVYGNGTQGHGVVQIIDDGEGEDEDD